MKKKYRADGYWKNWDNVENELRASFSNLIDQGVCPTTSMMELVGINSQAWSKPLHGGIEGIAKKLNCKRLSYGYLSRDGHLALSLNELILDEYLFSIGLDHEPNGILIEGKKFKYDQKVGNIYFEIFGYGVREKGYSIKYQEKRKRKEEEYAKLMKIKDIKIVALEEDFFGHNKNITEKLDKLFLDLRFKIERKHDFDIEKIIDCKGITEEYVLSQLRHVAEEMGYFPKKQELIDCGLSWLYGLIKKFGGINCCREKLGYEKRIQKHKWTFEKVVNDFVDLKNKLGKYPMVSDCSDVLRAAIVKHGGFAKLRKIVNYPMTLRPNGYWKDETIQEELNCLAGKLGRFPKGSECSPALRSNVYKHGGFKKFNMACMVSKDLLL